MRREQWVTVCGRKIIAFSRKQRLNTNLPRVPEGQGVVAFSDKLFLCFQCPRGRWKVATCSAEIATSALIEGQKLLDVSKISHRICSSINICLFGETHGPC
jgi:hypothetical protein